VTGYFESLINDVPGNADSLTSLAAEWDTYGNHCDGLADDVMSSASGTVITSPGFRLAYKEGRDQGRYDAEKNDAEKTLPDVAEGDAATLTEATAEGHETQPPGRYTEATLVKTMEELGIGRPSTYAATIQTIGDRGYVTHRGQYLVPTWLAFSVTRLLEDNLANLVDYDFTASMEGDLDRIAAGEENGTEFLTGFFFGPDGTGEKGGLRHDVASLGDDIDARAVNSIDLGRGVTLRVGRYGPYMEKADGTRANVPPEVAPDELTDELIDQLFSRAADDGREFTPLRFLTEHQARFDVWNSPLSEYGVLAFDYGYSLESPETLTIWEAQFGDFANGAQTVIDEFVRSAAAKRGGPRPPGPESSHDHLHRPPCHCDPGLNAPPNPRS